MPYAGGMARCRAICDDVVEKSYEGFTLYALTWSCQSQSRANA
jgi:hypothetical protein